MNVWKRYRCQKWKRSFISPFRAASGYVPGVIYDLYRIPFVMRDGLIGSFACAKLRPFVTPDPKNPLSLEDRKLILDLVGDLRLKAYLSREESVR